MRWPWQTRWDQDAVETSSASVQAMLRQAGIKGEIVARDTLYLRLDEDRLKALVYDAWPSSAVTYRESFPDCEDITAMAFGAVLYVAAREQFQYAPVLGEITYKRMVGGWHRAMWAITNKGRILIFEPGGSTGWRDFREEVDEVRSMEL